MRPQPPCQRRPWPAHSLRNEGPMHPRDRMLIATAVNVTITVLTIARLLMPDPRWGADLFLARSCTTRSPALSTTGS